MQLFKKMFNMEFLKWEDNKKFTNTNTFWKNVIPSKTIKSFFL